MSAMLRGMRIATIDLAMQDSKIIDEYFAHFTTVHLNMMLNLCESAWSTGDFGRSVDDEDSVEWGMDVPDDFPTGW